MVALQQRRGRIIHPLSPGAPRCRHFPQSLATPDCSKHSAVNTQHAIRDTLHRHKASPALISVQKLAQNSVGCAEKGWGPRKRWVWGPHTTQHHTQNHTAPQLAPGEPKEDPQSQLRGKPYLGETYNRTGLQTITKVSITSKH